MFFAPLVCVPQKRKVEDAKNGNEESTPTKRTPDVPVSQPVDSLSSTQESNISSDGSLSYSVEDIFQKINDLGLPEAAKKFRDGNISGAELDMLTEERLMCMGIGKIGDRLKILKFIRGISDEHQRKVFNDSVHGHIEIHPLWHIFLCKP